MRVYKLCHGWYLFVKMMTDGMNAHELAVRLQRKKGITKSKLSVD